MCSGCVVGVVGVVDVCVQVRVCVCVRERQRKRIREKSENFHLSLNKLCSYKSVPKRSGCQEDNGLSKLSGKQLVTGATFFVDVVVVDVEKFGLFVTRMINLAPSIKRFITCKPTPVILKTLELCLSLGLVKYKWYELRAPRSLQQPLIGRSQV